MEIKNLYRWQGKCYNAGANNPIDDMIRRGLISEEEKVSYEAFEYDMIFGMDDGHGRFVSFPMHMPGEHLYIIKKKAA